MSRFLNSRYTSLAPYTPGEQPQDQKYIKLNTNENPFPPSNEVVEAVLLESKRMNLYSDPECGVFLDALSKHFEVKKDEVFASNGSDEVLAFVFQALTEDGVAFADITYGFYKVYADLYKVDTKIIPLRENLILDPKDYCNLRRTIVIANPNAPTGSALEIEEIEMILDTNRNNLVVIDEAYVDFGAKSAIKLLKKYDNLLIIGTLSKSYSLAGARLGYAVSSKEIIADLNRIKFSFNPYNVNRMTLAAGAAAINNNAYFLKTRDQIIENREYTMTELKKMGFEFCDSKANFIFGRHAKICGKTIYQKLKQEGILVRWFDKEPIREYIRISIGNLDDMQILIGTIKKILDEQVDL